MINNFKIKKKLLSYYSISLVVLLLITVNQSSSILLFLLIGGSALLLTNTIYLLPVYIISSLSTNFFMAEDGIGISRLIGFVFIFGETLYQLRNHYPINRKPFFLLISILIYIFFSSITSLTGVLLPFIQLIQNLIIIFLLSQMRNIDIKELSKLLSAGAVITIIYLAVTLKENMVAVQIDRLTSTDSENPNRFATMVGQLTAIFFASFLIFKTNKVVRILYIVMILLAFLMLILSGSRSATIGILAAIIILLIILFKQQWKKTIIPLLVFIGIAILFSYEIQQLNIPFINRFTIEDIEKDGGTSRFGIWQIFIPYTAKNSLFFGWGFGGENSYALSKITGTRTAAHNFLIDMFVQTGLIGILLFSNYYLFVAKKIKIYIHNPFMYIPTLMVLAGLFNGIGETVYMEKFFWNATALVLLFANNLPDNSANVTKSNIDFGQLK